MRIISPLLPHSAAHTHTRVSLNSEAGVEYKNMLGSFKDAHTIECVDKKGKRSTITARRVVIAVGGRPKPLGIPGGEVSGLYVVCCNAFIVRFQLAVR